MKSFKMMMNLTLVFAVAMLLTAVIGCSKGSDSNTPADQNQTSDNESEEMAHVEQTVCPVMGEPIKPNIFVEYKGKKVYLCCPACKAKFLADPEKYLDKLPQFDGKPEHTGMDMDMHMNMDMPQEASRAVDMITGEQTMCPIMNKPINKDVFVEYEGKKVYFCCPGCKDTFNADPEKYVANLPQFKK